MQIFQLSFIWHFKAHPRTSNSKHSWWHEVVEKDNLRKCKGNFFQTHFFCLGWQNSYFSKKSLDSFVCCYQTYNSLLVLSLRLWHYFCHRIFSAPPGFWMTDQTHKSRFTGVKNILICKVLSWWDLGSRFSFSSDFLFSTCKPNVWFFQWHLRFQWQVWTWKIKKR